MPGTDGSAPHPTGASGARRPWAPRVGDAVGLKLRGRCSYREGTVSAVRDAACDLRMADGTEEKDVPVPPSAAAGDDAAAPTTAVPTTCSAAHLVPWTDEIDGLIENTVGVMVGDVVGVQVRGWATHYKGTVFAVRAMACDLKMADGTEEKDVPLTRKHLRPWAEADGTAQTKPDTAEPAQVGVKVAAADDGGGDDGGDLHVTDSVAFRRGLERKHLPLLSLAAVASVSVFVGLVGQSTSTDDTAQACDHLSEEHGVDTRAPLVMAAVCYFCLSLLSVSQAIRIATGDCGGRFPPTLKDLRQRVGVPLYASGQCVCGVMCAYLAFCVTVGPLLFAVLLNGGSLERTGYTNGTIIPEYCVSAPGNMVPCCTRAQWTVWSMVFPAALALPSVAVLLYGQFGRQGFQRSLTVSGNGAVGSRFVAPLWCSVPCLVLAGVVLQLIVVYSHESPVD